MTERTSKNKHNTMRRCHVCGKSLIDTIVHFGERYDDPDWSWTGFLAKSMMDGLDCFLESGLFLEKSMMDCGLFFGEKHDGSDCFFGGKH